jgi:cell wall-associated NlpC family hydrolase
MTLTAMMPVALRKGLCLWACGAALGAAPPEETVSRKPALVSSFAVDDLAGFASYPPLIQALIRQAAELTSQNLGYQFGSSDPKNGGMDCSGTIYRLLQSGGLRDAPRQSDELCRWIAHRSRLYRTENVGSLADPAFSALRPGDLVFWSGTYETGKPRQPPISHVMLYLGRRKADGKPIVFGASDGRTYEGKKRCGVSVFDFVLPKAGDKSALYGYGPLPAKP